MGVRPARIEDAARMAEIHVLGWQGGYRGLMPQDFLDGLHPAQRLARRIQYLQETDWSAGGSFVVANDGGELVGFADVSASRDPDCSAGSIGEVCALYLVPDAWGQGLGRELMNTAVRHLTSLGYRQATLWVLDGNRRARRFYEAAGFRPDGAVKVYDRHGFGLPEMRYRRSLA